MNTTAPRYKAGGLPPTQLHRAMPIDFVMSDDEEQEVRNGFDRAMKAPLPKREPVQSAEQKRLAEYHRGMRNAIPQEEPTNSTLEAEYGAYQPIDWASFRPLVIAGLVVAIAILSFWRLS